VTVVKEAKNHNSPDANGNQQSRENESRPEEYFFESV